MPVHQRNDRLDLLNCPPLERPWIVAVRGRLTRKERLSLRLRRQLFKPPFDHWWLDSKRRSAREVMVRSERLTNSGQRKLYGQYLKRDCFANPTYGQLGTAGNDQSQLRNPGLATEDLSAHTSVAFGPDGRYKFTFRAAFFNVFNRHQLAGPDTNLNDPTFGKIVNYGGLGVRIGQLGARLTF